MSRRRERPRRSRATPRKPQRPRAVSCHLSTEVSPANMQGGEPTAKAAIRGKQRRCDMVVLGEKHVKGAAGGAGGHRLDDDAVGAQPHRVFGRDYRVAAAE